MKSKFGIRNRKRVDSYTERYEKNVIINLGFEMNFLNYIPNHSAHVTTTTNFKQKANSLEAL